MRMCGRARVYVYTLSKATCAYVSWFLQRMLYTLVLDYKFHNLTLHSNFNPLAIPHTHIRIHTYAHTQIQRVHSGTMRVVKLGISILVLLFRSFLVLSIFHICALFFFHSDSFLLRIQFIHSEEILLFVLKQ